MPEKPTPKEFIKEISGAGPPTVPEKERKPPRLEIKWSPEAIERGKQLASQISELDQRIKTLEDQGDLQSAQPLFPQMEALVAELEGIRREEEKGEALCREMREIFKEGFLGLEEVERAFTLKDGSKLIELTPAEQEQSFSLLEEKLKEPDIREFLSRTPKEILQRDWLFILRVPQLQDKTPLTMKTLQERLAPDMAAQKQGQLLYKVDWYPNESFYTTEPIKDMHWQLVSRAVLPATKGEIHTQQSVLLKDQAQSLGLDPAKIRRRLLVEILYDFSVVLRTIGKRILEDEWDRTDTRSSDGHFVHVGHCDAKGARVDRRHPEHAFEDTGASLSR